MVEKRMEVLGQPVPIMEARDKVTGRTRYVDDMRAELFVKTLGSPHPHAMIKNIDVSKARKLKGVKAILTYKEVPDRQLLPTTHRKCYVMDRHLRHVGDYVAAVAATSEAVAEEALDLIDVKCDVLPAVFDPEEAMQPSAPKIFDEGNVYDSHFSSEPSVQEWGDIRKGFQEADAVVEDSFDVTPQLHSAIETHVTIARWRGDELTILSATQTPWELQDLACRLFQLPESKVVVLSPAVGGGFGGKYVGRDQFITCLLSRMAGGKSTKFTLTREEVQCKSMRPRCKLYAKAGAKKDGTITALQVTAYFNMGAYGNIINGSGTALLGIVNLSYKTKNARFECWDVHTNHFRSECMRSVSIPHMAFAVETIVDEVAEKLGLDPMEIRLKNVPESGDTMPPTPYAEGFFGEPRSQLDIYPAREMIERVMEKMEWKRKWKGFGKPTAINKSKRRGVGLAYTQGYSGFWSVFDTSIQVVINRDGSAIIQSGAQDIGQGINTTLRMLAAESLGISLDDVAILTGDTRTGQYDMINARSSHQLATDGHLLLNAIEEAKQKIRENAAPFFKVEPEDIVIKGKKAFPKEEPGNAIPLRRLLNGRVIGHAVGAPESMYPDVKPGVRAKQPLVMAVEVEVDVETGVVTPIKLVTAMFPGRMINPGVVRGQAVGAGVKSLGMALWEEVKFDEDASAYLNRDFTDYRIPRALDIPEIDTVLMEMTDEASPPHEGLPYGARGIGELSCWGAPAAVASAIYNATGVRMKKCPMTAETVLEALGKGGVE